MNKDKLFTLVLELLTEDRKGILYRPRMNAITGSITASIFLQQTFYMWKANGRKPFLKFNAPCDHAMYRPGKSWQEEVGMSRRELESAREQIAEKIHKKDWPVENGTALVYYWTDANRVTWYALNENLFVEKVTEAYSNSDLLMAETYITEMAESDIIQMAESANTVMAENAIPCIKEYKEVESSKNRRRTENQRDGYSPQIKISQNLPSNTVKERRNIKIPAPVEESTYEDEGNEFGDFTNDRKHYKWQESKTALAKRALAACGSVSGLFQEKRLKTRWTMIEKSILPLSSGLESKYPTEWVEEIVAWAEKKNNQYVRDNPSRRGIAIGLPQLLSAIENQERKEEWLRNRKEKVLPVSASIDDLTDNEVFMAPEVWDLD